MRKRALFIVCVLLGMVSPAVGSVRLITLPPRERVQIQLDHPHVTLVEEERFVPLVAGVNDVVFAWASANVHKASIQIRFLTAADNIRVLSVSYPPGENALTWQVFSPGALTAKARISYVVGGLDKSFTYRAVASNDERTLTLRQYILLHNRANEAFGSAGMWAGFGERFDRPVGINETKRLLSAKFVEVPIRKLYTANLSKHGYLDPTKNQLRVPMHYVITNDTDNGLGRFPLQPGKVRMFQDDGRGTVAFLGEDWAKFTPRDDEMKLFLGEAKDIVIKRTIERRKKVRVVGNLFNYDVVVKYEFENFKDKAVVLRLEESMPALRDEILRNTGRDVDWELLEGCTLHPLVDSEETTAVKVAFNVALPARGADQKAVKLVHKLHVLIKNEW